MWWYYGINGLILSRLFFERGFEMKRKGKQRCYGIRENLLWSIMGGIFLFIIGIYFKDELFEKWRESAGIENIVYEGISSNLKDPETCYLCGKSDYSMMSYYRRFDTIGVISLNDWYVLELRLKRHDENGNEVNGDGNTTFGNTGKISYSSDSNFNGTMASVKISLEDDYKLEIEKIQEYLCQRCLNKVLESLKFYKWKNEKKEAVPLCIVDFKTLEIYSLQDWQRGCLIRDYWVKIENNEDENKIEIDAYTIPQNTKLQ